MSTEDDMATAVVEYQPPLHPSIGKPPEGATPLEAGGAYKEPRPPSRQQSPTTAIPLHQGDAPPQNEADKTRQLERPPPGPPARPVAPSAELPPPSPATGSVRSLGRPQSAASIHTSNGDYSGLRFDEVVQMPPGADSRDGSPFAANGSNRASSRVSSGGWGSFGKSTNSYGGGSQVPPPPPQRVHGQQRGSGQRPPSQPRVPRPDSAQSQRRVRPPDSAPKQHLASTVQHRAASQAPSSGRPESFSELQAGTYHERWLQASSQFNEFATLMDAQTLTLGFTALQVMSNPASDQAFIVAESQVNRFISNIRQQLERQDGMQELQWVVQQRMEQEVSRQHSQGMQQNAAALHSHAMQQQQLSYYPAPPQHFVQSQLQQLQPDFAGAPRRHAPPPAGLYSAPIYGNPSNPMDVDGPSWTSVPAGHAAKADEDDYEMIGSFADDETVTQPPTKKSDRRRGRVQERKDAQEAKARKAKPAHNIPPPASVPDIPTPASTRPVEMPTVTAPAQSTAPQKRRATRVRGWKRQPPHLVAAARDIFRDLCAKLEPIANAMGVNVPALLNNLQGANAYSGASWNLFQQFFRLDDDYAPRRQWDDLFGNEPATTAYTKLRNEVGQASFDEIMQDFAVTYPNGTDRASELDAHEIFDDLVSQLQDTAAVMSAFYKIEIYCLVAGADIDHARDMVSLIMTERSSGFGRRSRLGVSSLLGLYRVHVLNAAAELDMAALFADTEAAFPRTDLRIGGAVQLPSVDKLPANPTGQQMRVTIYRTLKALFDGVHPSLFPYENSDNMPWKLLHRNLGINGLVLEGWDWPIPLPHLLGTRIDRGIGGLSASELALLYKQVTERPCRLRISWAEENDLATQEQFASPQGALAKFPVIISTPILLKDERSPWHNRRMVLYSNGMTTQLPVSELRALTELAADPAKTTTGRQTKKKGSTAYVEIAGDAAAPSGEATSAANDPEGSPAPPPAKRNLRSRPTTPRKPDQLEDGSDVENGVRASVPLADEDVANARDSRDAAEEPPAIDPSLEGHHAEDHAHGPVDDSDSELEREEQSGSDELSESEEHSERSDQDDEEDGQRRDDESHDGSVVPAKTLRSRKAVKMSPLEEHADLMARIKLLNDNIVLKKADRNAPVPWVYQSRDQLKVLTKRLKKLEAAGIVPHLQPGHATSSSREPTTSKKSARGAKATTAPKSPSKVQSLDKSQPAIAAASTASEDAGTRASSGRRSPSKRQQKEIETTLPPPSKGKAAVAAGGHESGPPRSSRKRKAGETDKEPEHSPKRPKLTGQPSNEKRVEVVMSSPRKKAASAAPNVPNVAGPAGLPAPPYRRFEGKDAVFVPVPPTANVPSDLSLPAGLDQERTLGVLTSIDAAVVLGESLNDDDKRELLYLRAVWPSRVGVHKWLRGLLDHVKSD